MKQYLILILYLILIGCHSSSNNDNDIFKCSATLTWIAPIERIDGTPLSVEELSKYTIYMSQEPNTENIFIERVIDLTDINLITWELGNINEGFHWFYMTVTDKEDQISPFSNIEGKQC